MSAWRGTLRWSRWKRALSSTRSLEKPEKLARLALAAGDVRWCEDDASSPSASASLKR
jgi:hypothetical protein